MSVGINRSGLIFNCGKSKTSGISEKKRKKNPLDFGGQKLLEKLWMLKSFTNFIETFWNRVQELTFFSLKYYKEEASNVNAIYEHWAIIWL